MLLSYYVTSGLFVVVWNMSAQTAFAVPPAVDLFLGVTSFSGSFVLAPVYVFSSLHTLG